MRLHCGWSESEWALIARMVLITSFAPAHVVANHATLARLDFGRATPELPTFAQLLSVHKNLTVVWHLNARPSLLVLTFALLAFSIGLESPFAFWCSMGARGGLNTPASSHLQGRQVLQDLRVVTKLCKRNVKGPGFACFRLQLSTRFV